MALTTDLHSPGPDVDTPTTDDNPRVPWWHNATRVHVAVFLTSYGLMFAAVIYELSLAGVR